jgi:hypothetical protein
VGAFSGAVYWWTADEYAEEQTMTPGRLWCNPLAANGKY